MRAARLLVIAVAVAAFTMLIASGPGTRMGLWPWQTGFALLKWATYTGLAAAVGAVALILLAVVPRWRAGVWVPVLALCFALVAAVPPIVLLQQSKTYPYIHDITTDPFDPPVFVALLAERNKSPNGAAYGGVKVAAAQQKGYPDIKSLVLKVPPQQAVQRAIDAARALDWEIVSMDTAAGRIEATATTKWFGFKDDMIVRVRPEGADGARVDVRSVSRVGDSDIGVNAKRIREFLARLT